MMCVRKGFLDFFWCVSLLVSSVRVRVRVRWQRVQQARVSSHGFRMPSVRYFSMCAEVAIEAFTTTNVCRGRIPSFHVDVDEDVYFWWSQTRVRIPRNTFPCPSMARDRNISFELVALLYFARRGGSGWPVSQHSERTEGCEENAISTRRQPVGLCLPLRRSLLLRGG